MTAAVESIAQSGTGHSTKAMYVDSLDAYYGSKHAVKNVTLNIEPGNVTAIIGPSGCGKSTLLRCLNRMHEVIPGARAKGRVLLDGEDIYASTADPVLVRRRVGMVFQRPNPFPTMSIQDNVTAGIRLTGRRGGHVLAEIVEKSLRDAALWDEVKDRLKAHRPHSIRRQRRDRAAPRRRPIRPARQAAGLA